jgi:hypothetical protein
MIQWFHEGEVKYIDKDAAISAIKDKINLVEKENLIGRILHLVCRNAETLDSKDLAELIVDGLCPSIIDVGEFDRAVEIAEEEINARKAVGDY